MPRPDKEFGSFPFPDDRDELKIPVFVKGIDIDHVLGLLEELGKLLHHVPSTVFNESMDGAWMEEVEWTVKHLIIELGGWHGIGRVLKAYAMLETRENQAVEFLRNIQSPLSPSTVPPFPTSSVWHAILDYAQKMESMRMAETAIMVGQVEKARDEVRRLARDNSKLQETIVELEAEVARRKPVIRMITVD